MDKLSAILKTSPPTVTFKELLRGLPIGLVLEFGVHQAATFNEICEAVPAIQPVHGFDSFHGLPEDWKPGLLQGAFSTRGLVPRVRDNGRLFAGMVQATVPHFVRAFGHERIAFAHFDLDLYSSTEFVLKQIGRMLNVGSILVFDELTGDRHNEQHEQRAFRDFLRLYPYELECLGKRHSESWAFRLL